MYDKRLSEFNYKLLNNILCCNLFLEKCKIRLNAKCDHFDEDTCSEDIMHLIYGCHNVNRVWKILGKILNFSVLGNILLYVFMKNQTHRLFFLIQSLHIYLIKSINSKCHA